MNPKSELAYKPCGTVFSEGPRHVCFHCLPRRCEVNHSGFHHLVLPTTAECRLHHLPDRTSPRRQTARIGIESGGVMSSSTNHFAPSRRLSSGLANARYVGRCRCARGVLGFGFCGGDDAGLRAPTIRPVRPRRRILRNRPTSRQRIRRLPKPAARLGPIPARPRWSNTTRKVSMKSSGTHVTDAATGVAFVP